MDSANPTINTPDSDLGQKSLRIEALYRVMYITAIARGKALNSPQKNPAREVDTRMIKGSKTDFDIRLNKANHISHGGAFVHPLVINSSGHHGDRHSPNFS